jgi:hypothetical protein
MTYIPDNISTLGFSTTDLLGNGATYDSTVLSIENWTQVQTSALSDVDGTIVIDFIRDSGGTDVLRTLTVPYVGGSGFKMYSAPAFTPFVRYRFTADQAGQTDFYFDTKFMAQSLSGQVLGLNDFIAPSMVANVGRNIIVGQNGAGDFNNVTVVTTTNDTGSYNNLQVVSGARPSQLEGRVPVELVIDIASSTLIHTVTASKTFYATDVLLTIINTNSNADGKCIIRNGTTVGGAEILPIGTPEATNNASALTTIAHAFNEPMVFDTGVFIEENSGTLLITGTIVGYEE